MWRRLSGREATGADQPSGETAFRRHGVPAAMFTTLEVTHAEAVTLLSLVRGRLAELERMAQNLEEGEGMDLPRHNALKTLRPQLEGLGDLALKLEGAAHELERKR